MTKDEALKMAIEFMETLTIDVGIKTWNEKHRKEAIQACKEALEQRDLYSEIKEGFDALKQPAQEPAYQVGEIVNPYGSNIKIKQPAPSWQGLSDDEIEKIYADTEPDSKLDTYYIVLSRAIEAKLKEKNHE